MRLQRRAGISILTISLLVILGAGGLIIAQQRQALRDIVNETFSASAAETATNLALALAVRDTFSMSRVIESSYIRKNGRFVALRDSNTKLVFVSPEDASDPNGNTACLGATLGTHDIVYGERVVGQLSYCYEPGLRASYRVPVELLAAMLAGLAIVWALIYSWFRYQTRSTDLFLRLIDSIDPNNPILDDSMARDPELAPLHAKLEALLEQLRRISKANTETERERATLQISRQVAHDIRSPLAALEMIIRDLDGLTDDRIQLLKLVTGRVREIANSLVERNLPPSFSSPSPSSESSAPGQPTLVVPSLIEAIVTESRLRYRVREGLTLVLEPDPLPQEAFSKGVASDFKRVLSNLIANAVEALPDSRGIVRCVLKVTASHVVIDVIDSGKGIAPEILPRLTERGATFGKDGGNGLGLYHAKQTTESWGGSLSINNEPSQGARVRVLLPRAPTPDWFLPEIQLKRENFIVVVDDDPAIHRMWRSRWASVELTDVTRFFSFTDSEEFFHWQNSHAEWLNAVLLIDLQMKIGQRNGLEILAALKAARRLPHLGVLVTSHADEDVTYKGVTSLGVKLLSKDRIATLRLGLQRY